MHLAADYIHPFSAENGARSKCRIRIFEPEDPADAPVVIFSELADNPGQSVTNAAEVIAGEVLTRHDFSGFKLPVFIEHWPPETCPARSPESFDLLTFDSYDVRCRRLWGERSPRYVYLIGEPDWQPLDRESVEALIGQALDTKERSR